MIFIKYLEFVEILYKLFQKSKKEGIFPNLYIGQHYPDTKIRQRHYKKGKLHINISLKHR